MRHLLASLLIAGLGCGATAQPIDLSPEWPNDPASLDDATRTWTRSARTLAGLDEDVELIIKVRATFRSPKWRAAYVAHMGENGDLSAAELAALRKRHEEDAAKYHEFALLVKTHDTRINDLAKGDRSMWRIKLLDAKGDEVAPVEIKKDRRPPAEIAAELPHLDAFDEIYIARFPATHPILGGKAFSLRFWSARASIKIDWAE